EGRGAFGSVPTLLQPADAPVSVGQRASVATFRLARGSGALVVACSIAARGFSRCAREGLPLRSRRALASGHHTASEALSAQRTCVPRLVASVGVVPLEFHPMSGMLASRVIRYVLLAFAALGTIFLFLLATASANTELFARSYDLLLILNGALVVLLMGLVGYQLWRLRRNLKAGVFGSRLAVRLVLLFALVVVLPGALLYGVSMQ